MFFSPKEHTLGLIPCIAGIYIDWIQKFSIQRVFRSIPILNSFCTTNIMPSLYFQCCLYLILKIYAYRLFIFDFCDPCSHTHIEFFSHAQTIRIFERSNVLPSTKICLTAKSTRGQHIITVRILCVFLVVFYGIRQRLENNIDRNNTILLMSKLTFTVLQKPLYCT